MTTDDTQAFSIRLPIPLHEELRKAAFDRREPMSAIITRGIEAELSRLRASTPDQHQPEEDR